MHFSVKVFECAFGMTNCPGGTSEFIKKKFWQTSSSIRYSHSSNNILKEGSSFVKKQSEGFMGRRLNDNLNLDLIMHRQSLKLLSNQKYKMNENPYIGKRSFALNTSKYSSSNNSGSNNSQRSLANNRNPLNKYNSNWSSKLELDDVSFKSKTIFKAKHRFDRLSFLRRKHLEYNYKKNLYFNYIDPFLKQKKIAKNIFLLNFLNSRKNKENLVESQSPINFAEIFTTNTHMNSSDGLKTNKSSLDKTKKSSDLIISIYSKSTQKYITLGSPQDLNVIRAFIESQSHQTNQKQIQKNIAKSIRLEKKSAQPEPPIAIKIRNLDKSGSKLGSEEDSSVKQKKSQQKRSLLIIPNRRKKISFKQKSSKEVESEQKITDKNMNKGGKSKSIRKSKTKNDLEEYQPNTMEDIKVHRDLNNQSIEELLISQKEQEFSNVFKNGLSISQNSTQLNSHHSNKFIINNLFYLFEDILTNRRKQD